MVEGDECRYCDSESSVVPVLDKNIERNPTGGGNKYRRRCLSCHRWLPMTSEEHYRSHLHPHVLPVGAETDVIPLEKYDYGPEWADLAADVGADATDQDGNPAMTDGGPEVDEPDDDPEPENEFVCPNDGCDSVQTGHPSRCTECGAVYDW